MTFTPEFKEALLQLPEKEKDKLLLRLLKKDVALANRLHFELLNTNTAEDQRELIRQKLLLLVERATLNFHSLYQLNIDIKYMSGLINEHVYMTKDKIGEISLNLEVMTQVMNANFQHLKLAQQHIAAPFFEALVSRIFKVLILIRKLHEDFRLEFNEELAFLGTQIQEIPCFLEVAKRKQLDLDWLFGEEIPKDISAIQKAARYY